jgi:AAA domain
MNSVSPPRPGDDDRAMKVYGPPPKPRARREPAGLPPGSVRLSEVKARPVEWLWPGWLPLGALVMIDGDPGVGKSTVTHDFAARVTTGRPWPDGQKCPRGNVLIMTAEEGLADTVLPRVELAGGDPSRVIVLTEIHTEAGARLPALPLDIPYVESIIMAQRIRLVTVDVLASYLGGEGRVNSHQDTDVRRALYPLFRMAERTRCCVVMLRHLNKQDGTKAMYRGGGSIGISGQARAVHLAAIDPDDPSETRRILAPVKVNNAPKPRALAYRIEADDPAPGAPARITWAGEDGHTAAELLASPPGEDERHDRDHTVGWIQDYLSNTEHGEAPMTQLRTAARDVGISYDSLKRACRRANVNFRRAGYQTGTMWALDSEVLAALKADCNGPPTLQSEHSEQPYGSALNAPNGEPPPARTNSALPAPASDPEIPAPASDRVRDKHQATDPGCVPGLA